MRIVAKHESIFSSIEMVERMLIQEGLQILRLTDHMLTSSNHHTAGLEHTTNLPACLQEVLCMMQDLPAVDKIKAAIRKRKGLGIVTDDLDRQSSLASKRSNGLGTNQWAWIRLKRRYTPAITGQGIAADTPSCTKIQGISRNFWEILRNQFPFQTSPKPVGRLLKRIVVVTGFDEGLLLRILPQGLHSLRPSQTFHQVTVTLPIKGT